MKFTLLLSFHLFALMYSGCVSFASVIERKERVEAIIITSNYCEVKYRRLISFSISYGAMIPHLLSPSPIQFQEACTPQKIDCINASLIF